jgi:hypothetical protein
MLTSGNQPARVEIPVASGTSTDCSGEPLRQVLLLITRCLQL